jgi:hypothetical protein
MILSGWPAQTKGFEAVFKSIELQRRRSTFVNVGVGAVFAAL